MMKITTNTHLILALDVLEKDKALQLMDSIYDLLDGVKINHLLVHNNGLKICKEIKKRYELPIIGDFKLADILDINERMVELAKENEIDAVTVHGFIGEDNLLFCKELINEINFIMITEFTKPSGILFPYKKHAQLAKKLGFVGVQAPATKPQIISDLRKIISDKMQIFSCGIGYQGVVPGEAIKAGADFEIVGRYIYLSNHPRESAKKIITAISEAKNEFCR